VKKENVKILRELGLNLIPCGLKSKRPSIEWKPYQTSQYKGDIPDSGNAAVICGRITGCTPIIVLDLDSPELSTILFEDFEKIKQKTLVVQTGSGGHHIYIRPRKEDSTAGKRLTNNKGQHMDIQGDGTYVIAPGSIHPNGNEYKIISSTTQIMEIDLTGFINTLPKYGFNTEGSGLQPVNDIAKGETREKTDRMDKWEREEAIQETLVILFGDCQNIDESEFIEKLPQTEPASKFFSESNARRLWQNWKKSNKLLANSDDTYRLEK